MHQCADIGVYQEMGLCSPMFAWREDVMLDYAVMVVTGKGKRFAGFAGVAGWRSNRSRE
jgi:hypothetical protein